MPTDPSRLDPDKFPWRVDLDLSEEVYERLLVLSRESGRPIQEIAEEVLGACVADLDAAEDP
jgi:predicted DNA-binding protein